MTYDKDFLLELDRAHEKEIYAKVTALTFQENPITTIEGRITAGSINVDGNSAVRRTCSLTVVAQNFNYTNYTWGLNTKFKLEVGVKNNINSFYPDIIWFPQGIFILTSFNTSRSTTNYSISLQGKDKMCLLNGEVGGSIESSVDFGVEEVVSSQGFTIMKKIPIPIIIRNMIHHYGGEPYHNIIINDLDDYGLELLEYRYDDPLYLYRSAEDGAPPLYDNILLNGNTECSVVGTDIKTLDDLGPNELEMLVDSLTGTPTPKEVIIDGKPWYVAKVEYGQTAGYRKTDLTYAGDLIANIGESITSVLDKIKNMLSDFEYFYNLDGQFVFQRKKSYINTLWSPIVETEDNDQYVESLALSSIYSYIFSGAELITSFSNNPNLLNMRNDYSVWGTRQAIGRSNPVHMRYAIDEKPTQYITIDTTDAEAQTLINAYNAKYDTQMESQKSEIYKSSDWDWRELIYQMAQDYFKYAHLFDDFEIRVRKANPNIPSGLTGYEQYYTDIVSFWRELYNPELDSKISTETGKKDKYDKKVDSLTTEKNHTDATVKNNVNGLLNGTLTIDKDIDENLPLVEDMIFYLGDTVIPSIEEKGTTAYAELAFANSQLTSLQTYRAELTSLLNENLEASETSKIKIETYQKDKENYYQDGDNKYWNKNVYEKPEALNFWFDFIGEGELSNFNVKAVGARPKVINDTAVKSIYFRETPNIIFISSMDEVEMGQTAYRYIPVQDIENMFAISTQGKSAKDRLDELIYTHGYCVENVTINAVPIYYLQPNTRIHLYDEESSLNGDYIISKITIPLGYNGTMQITATKAAENII